jgi:hypothetical protein
MQDIKTVYQHEANVERLFKSIKNSFHHAIRYQYHYIYHMIEYIYYMIEVQAFICLKGFYYGGSLL